MTTDSLDLRNMDCMELMKEYPDNYFDLAVVDPPYGIDAGKGIGRSLRNNSDVISKDWDDAVPDKNYFNELRRVSKNQIIWGGNYFFNDLASTRCFIFWSKPNMEGRDFADGELAWTSFNKVARVFKCSSIDLSRFHPTQKPIKLYDWIFANYAEKGMKILDTHMGSGSIAIAAHYAGMHLTASELDEDYFKEACERIDRETRQTTML